MKKSLFILLVMAAMVVTISCEGPVGPAGPEGTQGPAGPQGETGENASITTFEGVLSVDMYENFGEGTGWGIYIPVDPNKDFAITVLVGRYEDEGEFYFWYEPNWLVFVADNEGFFIAILYIPGETFFVETGQRYLITITGL